jgi:hypothetical protein
MILLGEAAGRWLEPAGDRRPRGMIAATPARAAGKGEKVRQELTVPPGDRRD